MADPTIGEIPDHWALTTLGDICKGAGGSIQTGPFGSQLHASDYVTVGIPSIMPVNIGDNRLIEEGIARITEADAERLSKHRVKAGDIIYSRRGDLERRALVRGHEEGWLCGTGCLKVRFGEGAVDPRYASYYLGHPSVRQWILRHAVGATMPNLNTAIMEAIPFALPPLLEQKAIAHILGTLDDKIELNRRMNETLEAMARAIFKSWFVDFDPVRAKMDGRQPTGMDAKTAALFPADFRDSELGPIPEGWSVLRLEKLTSRIGSGATPRGGGKVYVDEGIALVRSQNVYDFHFSWEGLARITDEAAKALDGVALEPEDVLFNITGASILRTCIVDPDVLPARVNQHVARIRARSPISPRFIHLHLVRSEMKHALLGLNAGATREAVTKGHLQSVRLATPPGGMHRAFDSIVGPIYAEKQNSLRRIRTLGALRDALLPKLLSGEISVKDAEKLVEKRLDNREGGEAEPLPRGKPRASTSVAVPVPAASHADSAEEGDSVAAGEARSAPIDEIDTDEVMATFRQAMRGRAFIHEEDLLKEVSLRLDYQRLGSKIREALKGHLRAAIRRKIVSRDGDYLHAETSSMADYTLDELRTFVCSVMRKGTTYDREDVIQATARHLGFARVRETVRGPIRSAINSAIRRGMLTYDGPSVWRE